MNSKKEKFKKYLYLTGDFFYKNRYFFQKIGFALLNVLFATLLTFIVLTLTPTNSVDQLRSSWCCRGEYRWKRPTSLR